MLKISLYNYGRTWYLAFTVEPKVILPGYHQNSTELPYKNMANQKFALLSHISCLEKKAVKKELLFISEVAL